MWDLKACRCCLATEPKLERVSETHSRLYCTVTGLKFNPGDGYPNYFCVECHTHLKKCLGFRRKSRRAFFALQTIMNAKKQITVKDIQQVDRKKNNLMSSLGNCQPNKYQCFKMTSATIKEEVPKILLSAKDFYNEIQNTSLFDTMTIKPTFKNYEPSFADHVYHIIDINGDEPEFPIEPKDEESPIIGEDTQIKDETVKEEIPIDMDDVFKDLGDDNIHSDDDEPDTTNLNEDIQDNNSDEEDAKEDIDKNETSNKKEMEEKLLNKEIRLKVKMLENCILIPQSFDEMKNNFKKRTETPIYAQAQLKCAICITVYTTVDQLIEHVRFHNKPEAVLACKVCSLRLKTEEEMLIHEAEDHNYLYHCLVCETDFYTLNEIKEHSKTHKEPKPKPHHKVDLHQHYDIIQATNQEMYESLQNFDIPSAMYKCGRCYLKFKFRSDCAAHVLKHIEPTTKTYQCDICKIWRKKRSSLELHMSKFHKYKYTCKTCGTVMFTRIEASYHRLKHKDDPQQMIYNCSICPRQFKDKRYLNVHKELNHYTEHYSHHCIACGHSYPTKEHLYHHQLFHHKRIILPSPYVGELQFMCVHCQTQFLTEDAYKMHIVKHRHPEANDIPYSCITCRMLYKDETEYNDHLQICSKYPRNCVYCETALNTPIESASHYRKHHPELAHHRLGTKASRYTLCEHCGKSVYYKRMFAHKMQHNKELPVCNHCEKHFASPHVLATHILNNHTVRPYRCAFCPAAYKNRKCCRDHILKTHAPVRPFSCDWCPLKFSHLDFMNEHITKIHEAPSEKPQKTTVKINSMFCTYPHMKVDISQLPKEIITKIKYEICDYRDQNTTKLQDYKKFFLTNPPPLDLVYAETRPLGVHATKPPKKKRKINKLEDKVKDELGDDKLGDDKLGDGEQGDVKLELGDQKLGDQKLGDQKLGDQKLGGDVSDFKMADQLEYVMEEIEIGNQAKMENEEMNQEEIIFDPNMQYEVIEQDGEQFVMVNNLLFKIETE